jgi:hypothetical protein
MNTLADDIFELLTDPITAFRPLPNEVEPPNPLDLLDDLDAEIDDLMGDMQMENEAILAPVTPALEAVQVKYAPRIAAIRERRSALEASIKADVLAHGQTIKGKWYSAIYAKGRVTWDTKALDGYALAHKELNELRKVGEPTVTIRKNGGK